MLSCNGTCQVCPFSDTAGQAARSYTIPGSPSDNSSKMPELVDLQHIFFFTLFLFRGSRFKAVITRDLGPDVMSLLRSQGDIDVGQSHNMSMCWMPAAHFFV